MHKYVIWVAILMFSCAGSRKIRQGIEGEVTWYEGSRMPGIGQTSLPGKPVKRVIYIYELTNRSQAKTSGGPFYQDIKTDMVKKTTTDAKGQFKASLPAGMYSLFTEEEKGLFANYLDGNGNINPVTVKTGEVTRIRIRIDYMAAY